MSAIGTSPVGNRIAVTQTIVLGDGVPVPVVFPVDPDGNPIVTARAFIFSLVPRYGTPLDFINDAAANLWVRVNFGIVLYSFTLAQVGRSFQVLVPANKIVFPLSNTVIYTGTGIANSAVLAVTTIYA